MKEILATLFCALRHLYSTHAKSKVISGVFRSIESQTWQYCRAGKFSSFFLVAEKFRVKLRANGGSSRPRSGISCSSDR